MRFVPYEQLDGVPNIVVDGAATRSTVLALSHWPGSGTPPALAADTSTEIVFRYLDTPSSHVEAHVVSNNHFDEDGLAGLTALLHPEVAMRHRARLIGVARAGDFGVVADRASARVAFVLAAFADPGRSPLPTDLFRLPAARLTGELYRHLLPELPDLLGGVDRYRTLWEAEDEALSASEALFDRGVITIEEHAGDDLAVVELHLDPAPLPASAFAECHPCALHSRTERTRIFLTRGRQAEFRYRYESWVQLASRRPALRVDLADVARALTALERDAGSWVFDGADSITPCLRYDGLVSRVPPDVVFEHIVAALRSEPPAWNPYEAPRVG